MSLSVIDNVSRFFTGAFDEQRLMRSGRAFSGFFGRPGIGSQIVTKQYRFDDNVVRSDKRISKMVPRSGHFAQHLGSLIKTIRVGDYTKFSRDFPLVVEHFAISKKDLETMTPVESNPYPGPEIEQTRMMYYSMRAIAEIRRRTEDMCNILAAQSLIEGVQDKIIGTAIQEEQYTWNRASGNFITVSTVWSNVAATIMSDLVGAARQLHREGKITQNEPLMVCLSPSTLDYVRQNTRIKDEGDNRRYMTVEVNPELQVPDSHKFMIQNGWVLDSRLKAQGWTFYLYSTEDWYEDDSLTKTQIMPNDKAIVTAPSVKMDSIFGPPTTFDMTADDARLFQQWFGFNPMVPPPGNNANDGSFQVIPNNAYHIIGATDKWKTAREFAVQLAPVFKPFQTDGIVTLQGLV